MINPSINLQELRRQIYRKAKAEKQWRFWGLYVHITKREALEMAYQEAKANDGSAGIDGETWEHYGEELEVRLKNLSGRLIRGAYRAPAVRRVYIPEDNTTLSVRLELVPARS